MQTIRPIPTRHHSRRSYFIFNKLFETSHVFVRVDHVRQPLEQPYEGRVIKHISDNVFLIDYKGKETTISTERLKSAYTEESERFQSQTYSRAKVSSTLPSRSSDLKGGSLATATSVQQVTSTSARSFRRKVRFHVAII